MAKKMSDGIVDPRTVLECLLHLQRHGTQPALRQLEATEPDLAEYLLETLSDVYQNLIALHASSARTRRVYRQIELMMLVCIQSLRQSHYQLWAQQMGDEPRSNPDDPASGSAGSPE